MGAKTNVSLGFAQIRPCPKLSLVSKTFRSLILSNELYVARFHLETTEDFFHVCLQLPHHHRPWFTLLIKPDQTLTNDLEKKQNPTGNTLLVRIPFSPYSPHVSLFTVRVGSEYYALEQNYAPSCIMWVRNKDIFFWREAPRMRVARVSAVAAVLDSKIYVMGGCGADQSTNWAEVYDTKSQTWESLPDPGHEIRVSRIKTIEVIQGKLYVISNEKDFVYDPKQGKWDVERKRFMICVMENVWYGCDENSCLWYDTKRKRWRVIRGLAMLNRNRCGNFVEIANYHGKLLILWDKFKRQGPYKNIWCAVIALERRNDDDEV